MISESSLLINNHFALRQVKGIPVYTEIRTETIAYSEQDIKDRINKASHLSPKNLERYREILRKSHKKEESKTDYPIDLSKLQWIVITHNAVGYISTAFLEFAKKNSISIYWIDGKGMVEACFMPTYFKRASIIIKQCESRINGKNIEIAKYLIGMKIKSQLMEHLIPKLNKAKSIKDVLQVEGNASRAYYQQWVFNDKWRWKGRHGRTSINANAVDPINATLNLGYTLLSRRMSEILLKRGFELSIGFMHHSETSTHYLEYAILRLHRAL